MTTLNAKEAKSRLEELFRVVDAGELVIIDRGDGALYQLLRHNDVTLKTADQVLKTGQRIPDLHPGAMVMHDDFDDELPDSFWLGEE